MRLDARAYRDACPCRRLSCAATPQRDATVVGWRQLIGREGSMHGFRRIATIVSVLLVTASLLVLGNPTWPGAQPRQLKRLNVQLGWIKNTEFAGLFVADQRGWFAQEGLDVTFISGGAGIEPINIVRANPSYLGVVASSGALINAVSRGAKLKALAAYY